MLASCQCLRSLCPRVSRNTYIHFSCSSTQKNSYLLFQGNRHLCCIPPRKAVSLSRCLGRHFVTCIVIEGCDPKKAMKQTMLYKDQKMMKLLGGPKTQHSLSHFRCVIYIYALLSFPILSGKQSNSKIKEELLGSHLPDAETIVQRLRHDQQACLVI